MSFKNDLKVLMKEYFSEIKKLFSKNRCEKWISDFGKIKKKIMKKKKKKEFITNKFLSFKYFINYYFEPLFGLRTFKYRSLKTIIAKANIKIANDS